MTTFDRCDLRTMGECSCEPSGVPCRVQRPVIEILTEANTKTATRGSYLVIALAVVVGIVFAISAKTGFDRQARAYESSGRV